MSFFNKLNINVKTKETREMLRYKDKLIKTYVVPKCTNLKSARRLTVILPKLANYYAQRSIQHSTS